MAEQEDKESKTEEATPHRIEEAIKKGNTPVSREVAQFASIGSIVPPVVVPSLPPAFACAHSSSVFGRPLRSRICTLTLPAGRSFAAMTSISAPTW